MNQKTAFKILGLGPEASLVQVKKAFRELAKQYHPDRFSANCSPIGKPLSASADARLNRMKEINQAFHFLVPLLTPPDVPTAKTSTDIPPFSKGKKTKVTPDKVTPGKNFLFQDILRRFKKGFAAYSKPVRKPNPCVQPPLKPSERLKKNPMKPARFSAILKTLHPAGTYDKKRMDCGRGCRPLPQDSRCFVRASGNQSYNRFLKYMALKKQIDAAKRYRGEQNFSRIEKIRPVTRINPIGTKQNS